MNRGDGMPPEAVVLTDDLSKSYPKQEDGEAFLKQCGFLAAEIAGILQKAYSK